MQTSCPSMKHQFLPRIFVLILWSFIALTLLVDLEHTPPLWWDEGWTLSVARNWVEMGHYGRLRDGQLYTAGLSGHFPVVALVALSFKLFGIGAWQGRLPGALLTLGALGFLFFLAFRLYNRRIAYGALFLVLLANSGKPLHPIFMGRQVMGELPALFFLLAGVTFFLWSLSKSGWWVLPAMFFWGIAIRLKAQEPYFWFISLIIPLIASLLKRWWKESLLLGTTLVGSWLLSNYGLAWVQSALISGHYISGQPLQDSIGVVAFVPILSVRLEALRLTMAYCLLTILGVGWVAWKSIRNFRIEDLNPTSEIVRWMLLVFSGGWFAWYLTLSMFWERYALQANFVGSIFGSALLYDLTKGFNIKYVLENIATLFRPFPGRRRGIRSIIFSLGYTAIVSWIVFSVFFTVFLGFNWYFPNQLISAKQVGDYINTYTTPGTKIESYESEVLFYLNRDYHYPSDQISIEFVRRKFIDPATPINYDALESNPDYLVTGRYEHRWNVYISRIESGAFRLIKEFPGYEIYERVRP